MSKLLLAISPTTHYNAEHIHTVRTEQEILAALQGLEQYHAFILDGEAIRLYDREAGRDFFMNPLYPIFEAAQSKKIPIHYFRSSGFDQIDYVQHTGVNVVNKENQGRVLEELLQK